MNPFSLLSRARVHVTGEIDVFNGGGGTSRDIPSSNQETEFLWTTQNLYFEDKNLSDPEPVSLAITRGMFLSDDLTGYQNYYTYGTLTDGIARIWDGDEDDHPYYDYIETLAIAKNKDVSAAPVALLDQRAKLIQGYDEHEFNYLDYSPKVVFFDSDPKPYRSNGFSVIYESYRERISEDNNDYWEGVFEYDINRDGNIPDYRPSEYPAFSEPDNNVNGKTIKGTNQNDNLKGKKKDDYIDGKNGNDILSGKKGNDILIGKKGFDQLYGQAGDDFLNGGEGDDLLEGGQGADVFKLSKGTDKITDFNVNEGDKIAIPAEYINDLVISTDSGDASIEVNRYGKIIFAGYDQELVGPINPDIFLRYI